MGDSITVNPHEVWSAEVDLSWFESVASDEMIAHKFMDVGFTHVTCTGSGEKRQVQGMWPWPTKTIAKRDLDPHITDIHRVSP